MTAPRLTEVQAREVLAHRDGISAAQDAMLTAAGFVPSDYNAQWVRDGEMFWPDGALRVAECDALRALGKNPNHGRMP